MTFAPATATFLPHGADCPTGHIDYRQSMARRPVDHPEQGPPSGGALSERIEDAIRRAGTTKAELARRTGKSWRLVHAWTTGEKAPSPESLRLLAEALPVTLEELMGVAAGQDPPFVAWAAFLATAEGAAMTPDERRSLQAIPWPPGREPTVASYQIALASLRTTTVRRA